MSSTMLPGIGSPADLHRLSEKDLQVLAAEMRNELIGVVGRRKRFLVVLNDNKMSICPRVGGLAYYLDKARMTPLYSDWNRRVRRLLPSIPLVGDQADRWLQQMKDAIKASLHGGMLFEEL